MTKKTTCQSCSMAIDDGTYCDYCTDENGNLQAFEERLERMIQWQLRHSPNTSPENAKTQSLTFMAEMPAWRDHPEVIANRG